MLGGLATTVTIQRIGLLAFALNGLVERTGVDAGMIDDVPGTTAGAREALAPFWSRLPKPEPPKPQWAT